MNSAQSSSGPTFVLRTGADLAALPPTPWRIRNIIPSKGLAAIYGQSGAGKTFFALDMAIAIAEGKSWFANPIKQGPVIYLALEGEGGLRNRIAAWEKFNGRQLPSAMRLVLQPFNLTDPQHIQQLSLVIPAGATIFVDTLNRAIPGADENSSKDMGLVIEGVKTLQSLIDGLVVLVHHAGKDNAKGMRGHSSLIAAVDTCIFVKKDDGRRSWTLEKSKDGSDGICGNFQLMSVDLERDEFGEITTSCVVHQILGSPAIRNAVLPRGANQSKAMEVVHGLLSSANPIDTPPLPSTYTAGKPAIQVASALPSIAAALTCSRDKRNYNAKAILTRLVSSGALRQESDWLWVP